MERRGKGGIKREKIKQERNLYRPMMMGVMYWGGGTIEFPAFDIQSKVMGRRNMNRFSTRGSTLVASLVALSFLSSCFPSL